ncbi:hypothetical protein L484_014982 [Morus notabilis]|uniref:Uncharacterized protein n=1 Tax=Morus notabilis TaxID=981085 RepID=W9SAG1_9ROSA|nr:hypothetical protein L484_014982 [Morus notabilis]
MPIQADYASYHVSKESTDATLCQVFPQSLKGLALKELFFIIQRLDELLRDYIKRFTKGVNVIPGCNDVVAICALKKGTTTRFTACRRDRRDFCQLSSHSRLTSFCLLSEPLTLHELLSALELLPPHELLTSNELLTANKPLTVNEPFAPHELLSALELLSPHELL